MFLLLGLVSLRKLDLSFNRIEKLDNKTHGLLEDCLSLEQVNILKLNKIVHSFKLFLIFQLDMSHNKVSFVSRKMFPSNPYFPYRLKDIDLSYNAMPVLTYDIVFGTQQVEKLNLSHNAIADIRRGKLTKHMLQGVYYILF